MASKTQKARQTFQAAKDLIPEIQIVPSSEVSARVASEMAAGGLFGEAQVYARSIPSSFWKGAAQAEIVEALLNASKLSDAEHIARGIKNADFRAQGISAVALARSGTKRPNADIEMRMAKYSSLYEQMQ